MKLSVCIPVCNVAPYIERCARSLFGQTYRDLEIVFVDDCSPDGSISIVGRVLKDYPNRAGQVKILRLERNRGAAAARKAAVDAATGDLIAFCDADDWVDSELYEKMIAQLERTNADAVMCPIRFEPSEGSGLRGRTDVFRVSGAEALRNMDAYPGLNSLVLRIARRELLKSDDYELPEGLNSAEDLCLSVQLLSRCRLLTNIAGGPVYHYRQHAASLSHAVRADRVVFDHARVFDVLERKVPADLRATACRYLAGSILYWGTTRGVLDRQAYGHWRKIHESLGGRYAFDEGCVWGQRLMKLADWNFTLARIAASLVRRRLHDRL